MLPRPLCAITAGVRCYASGSVGLATVKERKPSPDGKSYTPTMFKDYEVKTTRMPNEVTVSSMDTLKDVSQIGLVFRCGTRDEMVNTHGVVQRIRSAVGLGTEFLPYYEIGPLSAAFGNQFECYYTRENFWITLNCHREVSQLGIEFLGQLCLPSTEPHLRAALLSDRTPDVKDEAMELLGDPYDTMMDSLHVAAYGTGGLGNQLVMPPSVVARHGVKSVLEFSRDHLCSGNAGLVAMNVDHEALLRFAADHWEVNENPGKAPLASPFRGGQVRSSEDLANTYGAIVAEGAALNNLKGLATQAVVSTLLAGPPGVEQHLVTPLLHSAVAGVSEAGRVQVDTVNIAYSDSGLFGFQFATDPEHVSKVAKACMLAVREMASKGVPQDVFDTAKMHTQLLAVASEELQGGVLTTMAAKIVTSGFYNSPHDVIAAVGEVTNEEVQQYMKTLISKKLAMSLVGNTEHAPYLEDLSFA